MMSVSTSSSTTLSMMSIDCSSPAPTPAQIMKGNLARTSGARDMISKQTGAGLDCKDILQSSGQQEYKAYKPACATIPLVAVRVDVESKLDCSGLLVICEKFLVFLAASHR